MNKNVNISLIFFVRKNMNYVSYLVEFFLNLQGKSNHI